MVYKNYKNHSFWVRRDVPQGSVLGPVLLSFFTNDLSASLPSSISCAFYADDLVIWSSSLSVPAAVEATQGTLILLECWSEYWCLSLNPGECEDSFILGDPRQTNLQSHLLLFNCHLQLLLGSPLTTLFSKTCFFAEG